MTDIFSKISGQFNKNLLLGAFLPTALFIIIGLLLLAPIVPTDWLGLAPLEALGTEWKVIGVSFLTLILSGLLYNLNTPITRFYEGYPWQKSWFGQKRTEYYKAKFRFAQSRFQGLRTLVYAQRKVGETNESIVEYWQEVGLRINRDYPGREALVLPTRLGNVIRSFEYYPQQQYGIEAVILWPRLIAKIDKDYAGAIDEDKTSFDFLINCSVLSAVLSLIILITGLLYPIPFTEARAFTTWLVELVCLAAVSYFAYSASISRAQSWGSMVKAAFDLYRVELLKQLGYKQLPATVVQERLLWNALSRQFTYGDSPRIPLAIYDAKPGLAYATQPNGMELSVVRAVSVLTEGKVFVTLKVVNETTIKAEDIIVLDVVPDGYDYVWDANLPETLTYTTDATSEEPAPIRVVGVNPFRFHIGDVEGNKTNTFRYAIVKRA